MSRNSTTQRDVTCVDHLFHAVGMAYPVSEARLTAYVFGQVLRVETGVFLQSIEHWDTMIDAVLDIYPDLEPSTAILLLGEEMKKSAVRLFALTSPSVSDLAPTELLGEAERSALRAYCELAPTTDHTATIREALDRWDE